MHHVALENNQRQFNSRQKAQVYENNKLTSHMFRPTEGRLQTGISNCLNYYFIKVVFLDGCKNCAVLSVVQQSFVNQTTKPQL